jgi:hypothetical protein
MGMEVYPHAFLTSSLDGGKWSASRSGRFTLEVIAPRYSLDRRLGGPQNRSGCGGERKSHHCSSRESNPGRPARSPAHTTDGRTDTC